MRRAHTLLLLAALIGVGALPVAGNAENPDIAKRRAAERKVFTDAQIADGFFKVAFGAEMRLSGPSDRIRKYDGPVRVFIDSRGKPDRGAQLRDVIADIKARVQHLDIALSANRDDANVFVRIVRERDLPRTLQEAYGRARGREIMRRLEPQCLSGFRKDETLRITRSDVFLVSDAGEFIFYDCAYEELLQSLGPANDDSSVPWTMFNDEVQMGFFDIYDQYILNILYHPRVRPGMTRDEVRELLPEILPEVRDWVAKVNEPSR
jgi:Protein of unknown function (DUF2927)